VSDVNLIILGGGPAGTAAAIAAALRGLRAVIVERDEFPRHKPGETLHPGIEPLLRELGVWEEVERLGFIRHAGIQVAWGDKPRFVPYGEDKNGPWFGLQVWRADFDAVLLDRARRLGVEIRQPCSARGVLVRDGRVVGIETDRGPLRGDFVVDAGGGRHWLAGQLRLPIRFASPSLIARYGYVEGHSAEVCDRPAIISDETGWSWMARVRDTTYQWTRLTVNGLTPADARPVQLCGLKPTGPVRGADVTWRMVKHPAGSGYFLAGDAAAVLDPASSHGVLKAVMTGIMAGHCTGRILAGDNCEDEVCHFYNDWLRGWFDHDAARLNDLYARVHQEPCSV